MLSVRSCWISRARVAPTASRIAISRALLLKHRLIVLEEPSSGLDMSVQGHIVDLLRDLLTRHKLAYLFISHDIKVVRALADVVLLMSHV